MYAYQNTFSCKFSAWSGKLPKLQVGKVSRNYYHNIKTKISQSDLDPYTVTSLANKELRGVQIYKCQIAEFGPVKLAMDQ